MIKIEDKTIINCEDCPFQSQVDNHLFGCNLFSTAVGESKPDWCPLEKLIFHFDKEKLSKMGDI